ncbi:MAG TPA: serine hydrolase domain-containing protein [Actinomycetales bacterium]|nr:serine hydrolase domain-containing protein [Actinomycetales bacterium]
MDSVQLIDTWPVENAAAAVIKPSGRVVAQHGPVAEKFALASVSKLISSYAALVALEEEAVTLATPVTIAGATVEHLLSHTSGIAFDSMQIVAQPGQRRIYSNTGFELLAQTISEATGIPFDEYVREAVLEPLEMGSTSANGAAAGMVSTVEDLSRLAAELQQPKLVDSSTLESATKPVFPDVDGVLPGFGVQRPNPWGLGFEIRGEKSPHWTGAKNSPSTFGHFGQAGTFFWVDPAAQLAAVALTDRNFDKWAAQVWPEFSDAVLTEFAQ